MSTATILKEASLMTVGNLPEMTNFTFANSIRGAKIKFGNKCNIKRVVILDTEESIEASDERSKVIRSVLGSSCLIMSVPCIDDFRLRAFQTLAEELRRKDVEVLIVDITNGRRNQTFDLIIATSICRVDNVIITSIPRQYHTKPYWEIEENEYTVSTIRPFSKDRSLEVAAQFELIYYADRIHECVNGIREKQDSAVSGYSDTIERGLTNAVINYFSDEVDNLDNALKRLSELHEGIAKRFRCDISGSQDGQRFVDFVNHIRDELSQPARISAAEDDRVDQDLLAAVMLAELFDFCRKFRNYVSHPYHRRIGASEVRLMLFITFTILEEIAVVLSWLSRTRNKNVHRD